MKSKIDIVYDMETGDPDDFITMLFLGGHPRVNLKAVTVTPGGLDQFALVKWGLAQLGKGDLPVGVGRAKKADSKYVSSIHYKAFGEIPPTNEQPVPAEQVLLECCDQNTTFVEGAPLNNIGRAMNDERFAIGRAVVMGGFAGCNMVPPEKAMKKFAGVEMYPSFNVGGSIEQTDRLLSFPGVQKRLFVSKNVTHRVVYDRQVHERLSAVSFQSKSIDIIVKGMTVYMERKGEGKKLHDLLAAAAAIDETVCEFAEVEIYHTDKKDGWQKWGARPCKGTNTWISVDYDRKKFLEILCET